VLVLRALLHGEFPPGLKFRSAHWAEILLRLHAQFQPGHKTQVYSGAKTQSMRMLTFLFRPGMKKYGSDYMDFSARSAGLKILARFENTGLGFLARAESLSM